MPSTPFPLRRIVNRALPLSVFALGLTGCVFDSPYWAQTFATTTTPVPLQTWTIDKNHNVKIECSPAYHGGLQPPFGTPVWTTVTHITPSVNPSYDTKGAAVYSAGTQMVLPSACWHADGAYSPPKYMTALRATQQTASGSTTVYRVFDLTGLECLGRENGKGGSWFAWLTKNCAKTYSDGTTVIPWVKIIANAPGVAAAMAPGASSGAAQMMRFTPSMAAVAVAGAASAPATPPSAEPLDKTFQAEAIDQAWATPLETRLRNGFDATSPVGSRLIEASCRTTLCRVEVTHTDTAAQDRFVAAMAPLGLFSNNGITGLAFHQGDDKSGLRSVYFIARPGQDLSALATRR
ncbi:MAG: hypothetical protein V4739_04830 [Pseudomonadota bacterium]